MSAPGLRLGRSLIVFGFAVLCCLPTGSFARDAADGGGAEVSLPDSPVGRGFRAWLDAVNSRDREKVRAFVADTMAPPPNGELPVERITGDFFGRSQSSGGFDVRRVEAATDDKLSVTAQSRRFGYWHNLQMSVTPDAPHKVLGVREDDVAPPAELLPREKLTDGQVRERVDALVTKLIEADQFSGVILIARGNTPVYQRAAGLANRQWNVPNAVDTKFNLASIGKMFTGVAVMQLVEQGKLSLDDTVGHVLPDYPNADVARRVKVRHLLSHTSGLPSGGAESDDLFSKRYRNVGDYLPSFADAKLAFEPGSRFGYSNCGYYLLGAIIEKASGQTYRDYVRLHVFRPAGMTDTDNYDLETDPPNLSTGYMDAPGGGGGRRLSNALHLPVVGIPSGLGYSTAADMAKFAVALREHKLVSEATLNQMWTGQVDKGDGMYGLGCHVYQYNGLRIIGHGGGWVGITNRYEVYPDLGYAVVILNNIDSDPNPLALTVRGWLTQGLH